MYQSARRVTLFLLLVFVLLTGMASASSAPVMFRFDAAGTGDYSTVAGNPSNGVLLWKTHIGNASYTDHYLPSSPAVTDGTVYIGSDDFNVHAINAATGATVWMSPTSGGVSSSPAVANGIVYFTNYWESRLYALNAVTGAEIWHFTTDPGIMGYGPLISSSPVIADGCVYIQDEEGFIYKVLASSGARMGKLDAGYTYFSPLDGHTYHWSSGSNSPAVAGGMIYTTTAQQYDWLIDGPWLGLAYLNLRKFTTGLSPAWTTRMMDSPVWILASTPAVAGGRVYGVWNPFDSNNLSAHISAFDTASGAELWRYEPGATSIYSSPAVGNATVYIGCNDGNLYALDAGTGALKWNYPTGDGVISSPAFANGVLYFGSFNGNIYALNASTGSKIWNYTTGGYVRSSPAVYGGVVYVASDDGYLYALGEFAPVPVPGFSADFTSGQAPLTVQFTDASESLNTTAWNWDFGDGNWTNGTGSPPASTSFTYRVPGTWTVSLSLTNASGTNTTSKAGYIRAIGEPFSFDGPKITGISISPDNATTKKQITFEAEITQKDGYEVTGYHWIIYNTATGAIEWAEDSNNNPTTYMPGAGRYGNRQITCTIMYRETETGQIGFDAFSKRFKVFFEKGTYPNWVDDDHNGIPNWFEYWKRDRTIAGIESFSYTTYPEAGEYNPNNDTLFLGPDAPKTWPAFTLNTPRGAENFGGLVGINNSAASVLHESNHKWVTHQWMPGGQFEGRTDSDRGWSRGDEDDGLPDSYENNVSLTWNNTTDTYNMSGILASGYRTYGDQEYMCYRAEAGYWGAISPGKDWSNPGLQTTVTGTGAGAMGVSSLMGILSGPSYGTTGFGLMSVGNDSDSVTDTNGNTLYDILTVTTNVTVSRTGTYAIEGILSDSAGGFITRAVGEYELGVGTSPVSVDFPGTDIFHHGLDGPYNVSIRIYEASRESFLIENRPDAWQTAAYPYTRFEGAQVWFSGSYSDAGTDNNGDGAYEYLTVSVGVNDSFWNPYQVEGYLDTGNGSALIYATSPGISSNGETQVMLQFDGRQIGLSRQNGPYNLTSLALLDFSGHELQFISHAADTAAYQYTDFLPAGERITGPLHDDPIDSDDDGVNEQLAITMGVSITTPGTYVMTGLLSDSEGLAIARTGNLTTLSAGDQTVTLLFNGADISHHAVSGNYTLSSVMLSRSGENLPISWTGTYTTQEYDHRTFEQPPALIVQFHALPQAGPAPLSVIFFDDSTGSVTDWNWTFGDGATSTQQHPSHTYTAIGTYDVSLNVSNTYGSNLTEKAGFIDVVAPGEPLAANFTANITRGPAPLTVRFTDTSTGYPSMWNWHFGDTDFSMEKNPVFTFQNPGSYQIMLEVFGTGYNATIRPGYITVLAPGDVPTAVLFTANVTSGTAPFPVRFTDLSTGSRTGWNWSFGDGHFSSDQNPLHVYVLPGNYPVALTATNAFGSDTNLTPDYIHVFLKGDLNRNSRVDIGDVTRVAYMAVNLTSWDLAVDFDSNDKIDIADAAKIAWYYVGKVTGL